MSDEHKQYASTAAATLEAHILSVHSAKSEAEWWAHREINKLHAENEKLQRKLHDAIVKYQRMLMQYEPAKAAGLADATFKGDATDG